MTLRRQTVVQTILNRYFEKADVLRGDSVCKGGGQFWGNGDTRRGGHDLR